MRDADEILSPAVGTYRPPGAFDLPFFAARRHTLTVKHPDGQRVLQILIPAFGDLLWINVRDDDITWTPPPRDTSGR